MPWWIVEWTQAALDKCDQRGIDPDDVEDLVRRPGAAKLSRSSRRPIKFGHVRGRGELIAVVYEPIDRTTVRIITAYRV